MTRSGEGTIEERLALTRENRKSACFFHCVSSGFILGQPFVCLSRILSRLLKITGIRIISIRILLEGSDFRTREAWERW